MSALARGFTRVRGAPSRDQVQHVAPLPVTILKDYNIPIEVCDLPKIVPAAYQYCP
jgi:hypothetical protein